MRLILIVISLTISFTCFGQLDSIINETLNEREIVFLNSYLNKEKYDFDFSNKKIAFFSSPAGTVIRSKKDFFQYENDEIVGRKYFEIVEFTEKQKSKHGFDVAIIYESKNMKPKISNKLKRIVRKTKHNNV